MVTTLLQICNEFAHRSLEIAPELTKTCVAAAAISLGACMLDRWADSQMRHAVALQLKEDPIFNKYSKITPEQKELCKYCFTPGMTETDKEYVLFQFTKNPKMPLETLIQMGEKVFTPFTSGIEKAKILGAFSQVSSEKALEKVIKTYETLMTETLSVREKTDILVALCRIYPKRLETVIQAARRLFTEEMSGDEKAMLIEALNLTSNNRLGAVVHAAARLFDKETSRFGIAETVCILSRVPPKQLHNFVKLALLLFPQETRWREREMTAVYLYSVPTENLEKILIACQKLFPTGISDAEKRQLLRIFLHIPHQELINVFELFERFMNWNLSGAKKAELLISLQGVTPENLENRLRLAEKFITPGMSQETQAVILCALATVQPREVVARPTPLGVTLPGPITADLSPDLRWRLGIDRYRQAEGPFAFDRDTDTGFRSAMDHCWQLVDGIRDLRMNARLLTLIHDVCADGVSSIQGRLEKGVSPGWHYGIAASLMSQDKEALLAEWEAEKLILTPERESEIREQIGANPFLSEPERAEQLRLARGQYLARIEWGEECHTVIGQFKPGDERKIDAILNKFYQTASDPTASLDEKIAGLARCCRALLILHAFPDGNGRTICFALFNVLLHQLGLPPAILISPSIFTGARTTQELVDSIKEGLDYFQKSKIAAFAFEYSGHVPVVGDAEDYGAVQKLTDFHIDKLNRRNAYPHIQAEAEKLKPLLQIKQADQLKENIEED